MQLAPQAQEILGTSDVVMITERVDAGALRIGQMVKMGLPEVLDRPLPRHGTQRGLSWGWTAGMWRASIVTEGDHRQVSVETYLKGMHHPLSHRTAQVIAPLDFRDDRLSHLLQHLRKPAYGHQSEHDLHARSLAVYPLPQDVIRWDATTVSGAHEVTEAGLGPVGHSTEDPTRPQITVMRGSWDPLGMPRATDVVSGARAADGLELPSRERIRPGWHTTGRLLVGAWKMRALDTRAYRARHRDCDGSPSPLSTATAAAMEAWITPGVRKGEAGELGRIGRTNARGHEVLAAEGYEFERTCGAPDRDVQGRARVVVVRSPLHANQQTAGLEQRLPQAETALTALTPPRGRGKRQISDEATLVEAIASGLKAQRVDGLLRVAWEKQVEQTTPYVGRGRGSASRPKRGSQQTRDPITPIERQEDTMAERCQRLGWKAFGTKAGQQRRSLQDAVLCSRNAYRVERLFNRLKSRVHIAPLFVTLNEPIEGLTSLLTLGVRGGTVTEFVLRRSRATAQARLPGLPPEHKHKMTDKPTAERILKAFSALALTSIKTAAGEDMLRRLTPLSGLQEDILPRLGWGTALYGQLDMQGIAT